MFHVKTDPSTINFPVAEIIPDIKAHLIRENTLIVHAPPGAGKSTLLPLALVNEPWLEGKKIIMLEPRRLAARSIAARMASLLGEEVGQSVGYRIRFDNKVTNKTRIEVVTEGILTRKLQNDNALEDTGMVIFDEFHERSLFADTALVLSRESQQVLRPNLRIMVMSATLDMPKLSSVLQASVLQSEGKQYPVEIEHTGVRDLKNLPQTTSRIINQAVKNDEGDILAFLPGEGEIRQCEEFLQSLPADTSIHPLYGQLSPERQTDAILPHPHGKRKVVLATSIAETSLTIEGVSVVVDSGFTRTLRFDPATGLSRLTTVEITKDAADQRTGRAGRLGPGKCYRLWSLADENRMKDHRVPEMEESDLSSMMLDMALWGISDVYAFNWITPPPKSHVEQAMVLLHQLGALENNKITGHGREMAKIPCHPRIAHMLLTARDKKLLPLAADLAAVLEERDPLQREGGIDINRRVETLRRLRQAKRENGPWKRISKTAHQYCKMFGRSPENGHFDPYHSGFLVANAWPERIAMQREGNDVRFQLAGGQYATASHSDDLAYHDWLAVAHMDARQGQGKIFLAAPLNPVDLEPMISQTTTIKWDTRKGGLIASANQCIGSIVFRSKTMENPPREEIIHAICEVIKKEGENLLDFNPGVEQWQNRILSLARWRPSEEWPDVSVSALLKTCDQWLPPYLTDVTKNEDLKKIDLINALHYHLDPEKQQQLEKLAPPKLKVPSGSAIRLKYAPDGSPPVLAVRLQEMFGQADTPRVNNGQTPVLLHLLSPGFKPVQVTSDLQNFWNNTYYEVRKELKNRYPKHVWPDGPWNEPAVRGRRRKKR